MEENEPDDSMARDDFAQDKQVVMEIMVNVGTLRKNPLPRWRSAREI